MSEEIEMHELGQTRTFGIVDHRAWMEENIEGVKVPGHFMVEIKGSRIDRKNIPNLGAKM